MTFDVAALPDVSGSTVGILGGTGAQGRGLAYRLMLAGQRIRIGSRLADRARDCALELVGMAGSAPGVGHPVGGDNAFACEADLVIVAVPWPAHAETLKAYQQQLAGKIVIDCVNPLGFDGSGAYALPVAEGSAAQQAAKLLPESKVCAAFQHVSAALLADPRVAEIPLDVMVVADDRQAAAQVQALAWRIAGMRGVYAGPLRTAGSIEAFTANLIMINRRYKTHSGVRITEL